MTHSAVKLGSISLGAVIMGGSIFLSPLSTQPTFATDLQITADTATMKSRSVADIQADILSGISHSPLVDLSGVIDDEKEAEISSSLQQVLTDKGVSLYEIFINESLTTEQTEKLAANLQNQIGTKQSIFFVINTATTPRQVSYRYGSGISQSTFDTVRSGMKKESSSSNDDLTAMAQAGATALLESSDAGSYVWIGGGAVAILGGGGAALLYKKRRRKEKTAQQLEKARAIDPGDVEDLSAQPTSILEKLAAEELRSTDDSIRKGMQELEVAKAEFGEERTRPLQKALERSQRTLQEAYGLNQRLVSSMVRDEMERRSILIEIISSCGQADDNLDGKATEFAEKRHTLLNAPEQLDALTQKAVALRTRIPEAERTLEYLLQNHDKELLSSVSDNPDIAGLEITEAEKAISRGRDLLNRPVGKQAGLVEVIAHARLTLQQAESVLDGVEHAEEQLSTAQANLKDLIEEVAEELKELESFSTSNAPLNREALARAWDKATQALDNARATGDKDPLGAYAQLLEADSDLDTHIDEARGIQSDHNRTLALFDRTITDVQQRLRAVEDTIHTRGNIIGVEARTAAQTARDTVDAAFQRRTTNPREALALSQQARSFAEKASRLAKEDLERFDRRNNYNNRGGGTTGSLITGVVLGSLLSNNGGFGSSFGGGYGGGFSGGDFGGGGGVENF